MVSYKKQIRTHPVKEVALLSLIMIVQQSSFIVRFVWLSVVLRWCYYSGYCSVSQSESRFYQLMVGPEEISSKSTST